MDTNAFNAALRNFAQKTLPAAVERKVDALGAELLQKVREKTPVETGTARDAWELRKEGQGYGRVVRVVNPLPYVAGLEHGTSTQAPSGMVAVSLEEMKAGHK